MSGKTIITAALMLLTAIAATARTGGAGTGGTGDGADNARRHDIFFLEAMTQRQKGNTTAAFDLLRHCISIDPQSAEAHFYVAQYYLALKDKALAQAHFEKAAELEPDNEIYGETLARSYAGNGQTEEAIAAFERLAKTDTGRTDVLEILVQLYQQQGEYDNAIRTIERMEETEGRSERLSYAKSDIYTKKGDKQAAIAEMKRMADEHPYDLNYSGMYADMLMANGEEEKAMGILAGILAKEPDNNSAQLSMRSYYKMRGDTAAADSMTIALLTNKNTSAEGRLYLIRQEVTESESAGGDSTRIMELFGRMAAMTPPDADIIMMQAAYMDMKEMPKDSVRKTLERVIEIAPDNATARRQLVAFAAHDDDMDKIISLCGAGRQYNPDDIAFYYYQGLAYNQKGDADNALDAFSKGVSAIDGDTPSELVSDLYSALGELLMRKGRREEAYAAYDSCLAWKDDDALVLNNYAYYLCLDGRDLDRAEKMSYKSIKLKPDDANSLDTYAWIMFAQKRYAEAKVYIEQALMHDKDSSAVVLEHAGDIYAMNGDAEKAVEFWRKAQQKSPDSKILRRKIKQRKYIKE